jgi:hypothetical protein
MKSKYKSKSNAKLEGLGAETKRSNKKWREAEALRRETTLIKVEIVSWKQTSIIDKIVIR